MIIREGSERYFSKLEVACALWRAGSKLGCMTLHFQQEVVVKVSVSLSVSVFIFLSVLALLTL